MQHLDILCLSSAYEGQSNAVMEAMAMGVPVVATRVSAIPELVGDGDWHLVSNLPYSVSSPVLALVAGRPRPPQSFTVLVQLEVAERLVARPGSRQGRPRPEGPGKRPLCAGKDGAFLQHASGGSRGAAASSSLPLDVEGSNA